MNTTLRRFYLPMVLVVPMSIAACGGQEGEDDALVTDSTSLALASEDGSADTSSEEALGGMSADVDQAVDENVEATTGDTPEEGSVSITCNFSELRQRVIDRFDTNGDGQLDETERAALREELEDHPHARLVGHRLLGIRGRRPHYHVWARIRWAFDVDGDGQLSAEERSELVSALEARCARRKAAFLERYDANGDGQISRVELQAAIQAARERFQERRAQFLATYDTNGDGRLDETERAAVRADVMARIEEVRQNVLTTFDVNGDGHLDETEIAALKEAIRQRIAEGVEAALA